MSRGHLDEKLFLYMDYKSYTDIQRLLGKQVYITATCEIFPSTGIKGKLIGMEYSKSNELLYIVLVRGKKRIVGSNTAGIRISVIN